MEKNEKKKRRLMKKIEKYLKPLLHDLLIFGLTSVIYVYGGYKVLDYKLQDISNISATQSNMAVSIGKIETRLDAIEKDIDRVNDSIIKNVIEVNPDYAKIMKINKKTGEFDFTSFVVSEDDTLGVNTKTGEEYLPQEIMDKNNLYLYTQGEYTVVFLGAFNNHYNWDGTCIVNTYKNKKLVYVGYDSYDNGIMTASKQIYQVMIENDKTDGWSYYDKICETDYNYGNKWNYYRIEELDMKFTPESLNSTFLLYPWDVRDYVKENKVGDSMLQAFYHGRTSNGNTNDDTGNAYKVIYDKEGYISVFYHGKIKNGEFNDLSGNAVEIVYDESLKSYIKYQTTFESGVRKQAAEYEELTLEDAKKLVGEVAGDNHLFPANWRNDTL